MSPDPSSRAADIASRQVEAIVNAAQKAADAIRAEAEREGADARREGEREAKRVIAEAEVEAKRVRDEANVEAVGSLEKARKDAQEIEEAARKDAEQRMVAAQEAADEALSDARAMSHGLKRLGITLGDQAERMLRDVQAAHKRLTADLRVAGAGTSAERALPAGPKSREGEASAITELAARERAMSRGKRAKPAADAEEAEDEGESKATPLRGGRGRTSARENPFDDIDLPSWVEPGS